MNGDTQLAPVRRLVRRGAYALLGLALVALVAAACANAVGSPPALTAARTPVGAGAALGLARVGGSSVTTTTIAHPGVGAGSTPAVVGTDAAGVARTAAAGVPATSAAHASALPVPIALPGIAPPASLSDTCAQDVSAPMQHWLSTLAGGTIVRVPAGACYLIDEGLHLVGLHDITIIGGTWDDRAAPAPNASQTDMGAALWFVGGQGIALENLTVSGVSPGGYDPSGAFAAGIRSDGVSGFTVDDVFIDHVYGDGVELAPLRAGNDLGSTIIRPSENVVMNNVWIDGAGRQGVTLASVSGAQLSGLVFRAIGIDVFDAEADQWDEGAQNVDIESCHVKGDVGGLFFANGGAGSGSPWTSDVTVQHCTMDQPLGGDVIDIDNVASSGPQRGPITFDNDVLRCGASDYVTCMEVSNGNLNVDNTFVRVPSGTVHEPIYNATNGSTVTFDNDVVAGYGSPGTADRSSSVAVQGGSWTPYSGSSGSAPAGSSTTTTSTTTPSGSSGSSGSTSGTTVPPPHSTTSTTEPKTTTTAPARSSRTTTTTTTTTLPLLSSLSGSGSAKRN